jgi:hypothetical protein
LEFLNFLACCAFLSELAFDEINVSSIINSNGLYFIGTKLLVNFEKNINNKDLRNLQLNALRVLRIIYSVDKKNCNLKKIFSNDILEQFVSIGNFQKDLKNYSNLLHTINHLSASDIF